MLGPVLSKCLEEPSPGMPSLFPAIRFVQIKKKDAEIAALEVSKVRGYKFRTVLSTYCIEEGSTSAGALKFAVIPGGGLPSAASTGFSARLHRQ